MEARRTKRDTTNSTVKLRNLPNEIRKTDIMTINCSDSISPELKHLRIEGGQINHFLWLPYGRGYVEIFKSEGTGLRNQADYMKLESTSTYFRKCSFLRGKEMNVITEKNSSSWMNPQINSLKSRSSFSDKKYHTILDLVTGTNVHCFDVAVHVLPASVYMVHLLKSYLHGKKVIPDFFM